MPNTQSAKKRLRQNEKHRVHNQSAKTRIKTETKNVLAGGELSAAYSVIDRAASKGVIHKNAAARKKSRLAKRIAAAAKA